MMLSARKLAERWSCHRDTIYKMIDRGDLPVRRIGGMVRIPLTAVEAIEEGRPWQDEHAGTGPSGEASSASGASAGLRIVGSEPEAFAQLMKLRQTSGSIASSPNSTSPPGPRHQP
jgi:excisionase family DNA binding protein